MVEGSIFEHVLVDDRSPFPTESVLFLNRRGFPATVSMVVGEDAIREYLGQNMLLYGLDHYRFPTAVVVMAEVLGCKIDWAFNKSVHYEDLFRHSLSQCQILEESLASARNILMANIILPAELGKEPTADPKTFLEHEENGLAGLEKKVRALHYEIHFGSLVLCPGQTRDMLHKRVQDIFGELLRIREILAPFTKPK